MEVRVPYPLPFRQNEVSAHLIAPDIVELPMMTWFSVIESARRERRPAAPRTIDGFRCRLKNKAHQQNSNLFQRSTAAHSDSE